jgi:hypothetical protein
MAKRLAGRIAFIAFLVAAPAWAEPPTTAVIGTPSQPTWSKLSPGQRAVLAPLGAEWDRLDHIRRKKWLLIAERFPSLKPDEQRRLHDRMREWALLTPEQREKVRDNYKEFNQLPAERRQAVKQKWETYNSLSEEEKAQARRDGRLPKPASEPKPTSEAAASKSAVTPTAQAAP